MHFIIENRGQGGVDRGIEPYAGNFPRAEKSVIMEPPVASQAVIAVPVAAPEYYVQDVPLPVRLDGIAYDRNLVHIDADAELLAEFPPEGL